MILECMQIDSSILGAREDEDHERKVYPPTDKRLEFMMTVWLTCNPPRQ